MLTYAETVAMRDMMVRVAADIRATGDRLCRYLCRLLGATYGDHYCMTDARTYEVRHGSDYCVISVGGVGRLWSYGYHLHHDQTGMCGGGGIYGDLYESRTAACAGALSWMSGRIGRGVTQRDIEAMRTQMARDIAHDERIVISQEPVQLSLW